MKQKLFYLFLSFILASPIVIADAFDDYADLDRIWEIQKPVTNQEFDTVMNALEEKKNKKDSKKQKKKRKKISGGGTSLHEELDPDLTIPEMESLKPKEEGLLINTFVDLVINGQTLEKGYYKIIAQKERNKIYILFYQSQFFKGKIEATETEDDYGEKELDFARLLPFNDSFVKIIFGSIDFNAYVYVPYINERY